MVKVFQDQKFIVKKWSSKNLKLYSMYSMFSLKIAISSDFTCSLYCSCSHK